MQLTPGTVLQILILTTGIYLVLSFLRTTRGSGLVRGLAVAALVLVVGLWGLSRSLELEELEHIIQGTTGYLVVVLAILFQPELRRGIVHLGENPMLGRFLKTGRNDVITEVAQAVTTMAGKRQGALIAFERRIALDAFLEGAVRIDAEVNRFLLDSIFHHGNALHDGAVIIRGDRIEGATSLFPLTENAEISKSTGTRHRAALGLTEETDAVTVAVSEETGSVSICKGGKIEPRVPPTQLEELLRDRLGYDESSHGDLQAERGVIARAGRFFTDHPVQKIGALVLGTGLYWFAYQDIRTAVPVQLSIDVAVQGGFGATPLVDRLQIILPDRGFHVAEPRVGELLGVEFSGTRFALDALKAGVGGVLLLGPDTPSGPFEIPLDDVTWGPASLPEGVIVNWQTQPPPRLEIERYEERRITLDARSVTIDATGANPRYQVRAEAITIEPSSVVVAVPTGALEDLDAGRLTRLLEPIVLDAGDVSARTFQLGLARALADRGFALIGDQTVKVEVPILPAEHAVGPIEKEIALVCFSSSRQRELAGRWAPPTQKMVFQVTAVGILPASDPGSPTWIEKAAEVRQFVEENLRVYVDLEMVAAQEGSKAEVQWDMARDWRVEFGIEELHANLSIIPTSETELLLSPLEASESDDGHGSDEDL